MEWYDHRLREGIGRYAAEKNWYLTVNDGCRLPQGWSGDGIITLLNRLENLIRLFNQERSNRLIRLNTIPRTFTTQQFHKFNIRIELFSNRI